MSMPETRITLATPALLIQISVDTLNLHLSDIEEKRSPGPPPSR